MKKDYLFKKNHLYITNISFLIFLSLKLKLIFSIIKSFEIIQFEFKNRVILKISKKFIIIIINLFVYYLIIEINNSKSLLVIKLMILYIIYKVFRNIGIINHNTIKLKKR